MLTNPSAGRRFAGRLTVVAAVALALPLTATRAIEYVDKVVPAAPTAVPVTPAAAPAPVAPVSPAAPLAPIAAVAPAAPVAPDHPRNLHFDNDGTIYINGQAKRWNDLTRAEKDECRRAIAEAKQELSRTHIDREEIQRDIREAMEDSKFDQEDLRRDLAEARQEIEQAVREVDRHAVNIRRSGQDPEQIKATIRESLRSVEAIDVEGIRRKALASVDQRAIEASVAAAEQSIAKAQADIERLEDQFEDDDD